MSDIERLQTIIQKLTGKKLRDRQISQWNPIDQQSNHIYQVQFDNTHWIAKIFLKPDEFDNAPHREYEAMRLLSSLDIAPQAIHYEKHDLNHNPIVIYEFMAGEMWDRYTPNKDELGQLADVWLLMNDVSTESLWLSRGFEQTGNQIRNRFIARLNHYSDWVDVNFPAAKPAAIYMQNIAEKRLDVIEPLFQMQPTFCFCRSDPRFANVIRRPDDRLGLIDWEDSGLRDPARDVADILVHPNQEDLLTWDAWQAFLEPYLHERRKIDATIDERIRLYNAVFPMFWLSGLVVYGIKQWQAGSLDNWTINAMNPNQRLRWYLARLMAFPNMDFAKELNEIEDLVFFDV